METTHTTHELPLSKKKVEVYDWISAQEAQSIQERHLKKMKGSVRGREVQMDDIEGTLGLEQDRALVQAYVKEMDGKKPSIDELLKLPNKDYRFLISIVNEKEADDKDDSDPLDEQQ
jgi:hypothetical protein